MKETYRMRLIKSMIAAALAALCILAASGCCGFSFSDGNTVSSSIDSDSQKDRIIRSKSFPEGLLSAQDFESEDFDSTVVIADVSSWTGEIDFAAAKEKGISGVVIRLARYNLSLDKKFLDNYKSAKAAGLPVGCYYFSGANSAEDALNEAQTVLDIIRENTLEFELPVFFDVEDDGSNNINTLSRQTVTDIVDAFCGFLCKNGILSGYYASHSFADNNMYSSQLRDYPFWIAEWTYEIKADMYKNVFLWQYTSELSVTGMEEKCDGNRPLRDIVTYTKDFKESFKKLIDEKE